LTTRPAVQTVAAGDLQGQTSTAWTPGCLFIKPDRKQKPNKTGDDEVNNNWSLEI